MGNTKILNKNIFIIAFITIFIFFWDFSKTNNFNFDIRLTIFFLSPFLLKNIIDDITNKNFKYILISIFIFIILIIHNYLAGGNFNLKFLFSIIFLIYLFGISFYYHNIILKYKFFLILLFVCLFFSSILFESFLPFSSNPEPYSCGAIKNYLLDKNNSESLMFILHFLSSYSLIFNENSHLAMSSVAVIIYSILLITENKIHVFFKILLSIFILICFLKSSATLIAGLSFSIISLLLFNYNSLNKYFSFISIIILIILISIFLQDKVCKKKIIPSSNDIRKINQNIFAFQDKKIFSFEKKKTDEDFEKKKTDEDELELSLDRNLRGSLSSDVFFHAANITLYSIQKKPFGWGFQGYEKAFLEYNEIYLHPNDTLNNFNSKDGSSNFFKLIVEFGIFSFVLFFIVFIFLISSKISNENKIFLIPFIVTQTIRGAGYFNGGYLLLLLILIMVYFTDTKNSKIENS